MPLYISHFLIAEENLWLGEVAPYEVLRSTICYQIQTQLFAAASAEHAYAKALEMRDGFSDANCDGPGDRTTFRCIGIHDLDEVFLGGISLSESLEQSYGLDVGSLPYGENVPSVPSRDALSVFRFPA